MDVTPQDHYVPPVCSELDASCVMPFDHDAWVPVAVQVNPTAACPSDFANYDFVTAPQLAPNACSCGSCVIVSGTWVCGGAVTISASTGTASCAADTIFTSASGCVNLSKSYVGGEVNVGVTAPNLAGMPTCSSTLTGNGDTTATPVRACRPTQCTSDYCGQAGAGFSLCILSNSADAGCPTGFQALPSSFPAGQVDVDADIQSACAPCTCGVDPASCVADYKTFDLPDCGTVIGGNVFGADGGCDDNGVHTVASIYYDPHAAPTATCTTANPAGSGGVRLLAPSVICCAQ